MVVVSKRLVVHGVLARVRCRGNIRRPSSVVAEFVLHCAAVGNACRNQIERTAGIDKVFNCRRYRRKRSICSIDLKLRRFLRAVVICSCRNRRLDNIVAYRGRNDFGKRSVGNRGVSKRRRAELRRGNGHFGFFAVCPTFQSRDLVRRLGNSELQSNLGCIIAVRRCPFVICFIGQFQYNVVFSYIRTAFVENNLVAIVLRYYRGQFTARVDLRSNGRSFQLCF